MQHVRDALMRGLQSFQGTQRFRTQQTTPTSQIMNRITSFTQIVLISIAGSTLVAAPFDNQELRVEIRDLESEASKFYRHGRYEAAAAALEKVLKLIQSESERDRSSELFCRRKLAEVYLSRGDFTNARLQARSLLDLIKAMDADGKGGSDRSMAYCWADVADLYRDSGAYAEAESEYKRALASAEGAGGKDNESVVAALRGWAELYRRQKLYERAEPLYQRALTIREKSKGSDHPDVAFILTDLAELYLAQGAHAKAEPLFQRALTIREDALGEGTMVNPEYPEVADSLNHLAGFYHASGADTKAEPLYMRALALAEKVAGPEHPYVAVILNNLGELYRSQGAFAKAEPFHKRALAIREKALLPEHPDVAISLKNLAAVYRSLKRNREAEELEKRLGIVKSGKP